MNKDLYDGQKGSLFHDSTNRIYSYKRNSSRVSEQPTLALILLLIGLLIDAFELLISDVC